MIFWPDDPVPTTDDDNADSVQSPSADRTHARELSQWANVGVVVCPRPTDHTYQEDRVSHVHISPDQIAAAKGVLARAYVTGVLDIRCS